MDDDRLFSFWYAYEGGILLVLMHAALSARAASNNGLDESEIERATDPVAFTDAAECSICIAPHERRGSVKLACGHCFHAPCIARWLGRARTCPVCRGSVRPDNVTNGSDDGTDSGPDDGTNGTDSGPDNGSIGPVRPNATRRSRTVRRYEPYGLYGLDGLDGLGDGLGPFDLTP